MFIKRHGEFLEGRMEPLQFVLALLDGGSQRLNPVCKALKPFVSLLSSRFGFGQEFGPSVKSVDSGNRPTRRSRTATSPVEEVRF
jgi:hypothetical protein